MKYDFVTFDCYGTLIDWESGITEAFEKAGIRVERDALIRAYHQEEPLVESASYRRYRDVLSETGLRVAEKLGQPVKSAAFLAESLPSWKPFPDTNAALESLRRGGVSLGILSNVDDELLAETLRHFTVEFALIITAEKVQSYKPAHGHFLEAKKRLQNRRWIHAAQSYFHDIVPTGALGIPSAWINRKSEKPTGPVLPTAEFRDLAEFAQWMGKQIEN